MTIYLDADTIIAINLEHGGPGAGARDVEGIQAAAARPMATGFGQDLFPDVWSKAAAYLHGLSNTQYFHDGNKRTAWLVVDAFLTLNGYPIPDLPEVEAEAFVLSVAKDLFSSDDEPDRTIESAAEWFRTQWETQRVGPAFDPRVEYAFLSTGGGVREDSTFRAECAGVVMFGSPRFPTPPVHLILFARIHWLPKDLGREHDIRVDVLPTSEAGGKVDDARGYVAVGEPVRGAHAHHRAGIIPSLLAVELNPVFLDPGDYEVLVRIDRQPAARIPLRVQQVDEPFWSVAG